MAGLASVFHGHADAAQQPQVTEAEARIVTARNAVSRYAQMASTKALLAKRNGHEAGFASARR